ncbi:MAG: pyridoxine 5'-phosphate synthase [Myxococcota bacterium]
MRVDLSVNIDHVATIRQARGGDYPDPTRAAVLCELAGADGITVHVREDRRHAQDRDLRLLRELCTTRLNLEMAATDDMVALALEVGPDIVTLVPERREERTTEDELDVAGHRDELKDVVEHLRAAQIPVSMFIDPEAPQVDASAEVGAQAIELHTGDYAHASEPERELVRLAGAAEHAANRGDLFIAAGHGLTVRNVGALVAAVPQVRELNIGHALVADAVFVGLQSAVLAFRQAIDAGESRR